MTPAGPFGAPRSGPADRRTPLARKRHLAFRQPLGKNRAVRPTSHRSSLMPSPRLLVPALCLLLPAPLFPADRGADLAVIRIDVKDLPALELGNSDDVRQGRDVVSLGNPRGLEYSVAGGVVSARRDVEGRPMIELRMPVEPGNSGGPLLDL